MGLMNDPKAWGKIVMNLNLNGGKVKSLIKINLIISHSWLVKETVIYL